MMISRTSFIFVSSVFLTLVTAFSSLYTLRLEQQELHNLVQSISRHPSEYNDLKEQLLEINNYIRELEEDNRRVKEHNHQLEDIVFARKNNYLVAINLRGADIPVLSKSGFNADMLDRAWRELGAEGMVSISESFVQAEKEFGVNALVIASIAAHESNFGRSNLAVNKNNMFG
ncbi:MAG: glucosaminidase domain-containing protein, partial [Bacillota bacterium]|nr:glucosaminidase domain-containing protein [Bacillota bacterium]